MSNNTRINRIAAATAAAGVLVSGATNAATHSIFVGVGYNSTTNKNEIVSINPSTGATSVLNSFTFDSGGYFGIVPGQQGNFYALSSALTLYDFNATTGQILSTTPISYPSLQTIVSLPSGLKGIGYNASTNKNEIVSINAKTGAISVLNSFSFDSAGYNGSLVPGQDNNFYALSSAPTLYNFSALSGQILSTTPIPYPPLQNLVSLPSALVGIGYNTATNKNEIVSIDAKTGATSVSNSFTFDSGGYYGSLVPGQDDNFYALSSAPTLYDFSALSGQILSTTPISYPSLQTFTVVMAVPEPATYAMIIAGFGLLGLGLRRKHTRRDFLASRTARKARSSSAA